MFKGILTQMLSSKSISGGYSLSEDEDFIYLYKSQQPVRVFSAHTATIETIEEVISNDSTTD